nr:HEAT repeat domain-containing protein [Myxococcus sp. AM009]
MARPGAAVGPILSVLQLAWWPPPARLADASVRAVTAALTGLEAGHPAVEDAALVLANVCRVAPAQLAAVPLLPRLVPLLKAEEDVAGAALESLGALASLAPEVATPALLEEARTAEGTRLYLALTSLRSLVEDARRKGGALPALPGLHEAMRRALEASEPAIRVEALSLLGLTGPASPAVQEAVAGHLQDANPSVAACAAVALLRLGAPAQPALSLLQTQLSSVDAPELRGAALSALEEVEPATLGQAKGMLRTVVDTSSGPTRDAVKVLLDALG